MEIESPVGGGGPEKRQHLRLSAMGPVEIVVQGGESQEAYLASIGRGGLGIYLREKVTPPQLILVNLRLMAKDGDPDELKVAARVRWARQAGDLYMVGMAFEQMSDARYTALLGHLRIIERLQLRERVPPPVSRPRFTAKD